MRVENKFAQYDILIFATLITSIAFRDVPVLSVYGKLVFPAILLLMYISGHKLVIKKYKANFFGIYLLFFVFCLLSYFWAIKSNYVVSECFVLLRLYFTVFTIGLVINNVEDIQKSIKLIHITGIFLIIRLLIRTPLSIWKDAIYGSYDISTGAGRIGTTIAYHPNELGTLCFLILFIAVYYYMKKHTLFRLAWIVVLVVILLFTKSRTSLLLTIIGIAVFFVVSEQRKSKQVLLVLVGVVAFAFITWAIFNIPVLYELVGFRFEGILGNKYQQDASTSARIAFLGYAISLFKNHPVIGIGLDNFKYYAYNFANAWEEVYAHSNWGELLADTGIIGTTLYYLPQVISTISLFQSLKKLDNENRKLCALLFTFSIVTLFGDWQKMSYDQFEVFFTCMLSYFSAHYFKQLATKSQEI